MAAGDVRAGAAFIELSVNDSALVKGLSRAAGRLKSFGSEVSAVGDKLTSIGTSAIGLGTAIAAPLGASVLAFASMGDALEEASQRTGITVEALSELQFVAAQSGVEIGSLESSIGRMQKTLAQAAEGSKESSEAFKRIGLSVGQLAGLAPDKQFELIADRLGEIRDPAERARAAMAIFGRGGAAILPLAGNVTDLRDRFRDLGLTISTESARDASRLSDAFGLLLAVGKNIAFTVGGALAPVFEELSDSLAKTGASLRDFISENKGLLVSALKLVPALVAGGAAAIGIGVALSTVGGIISTVAGIAAAVLPLILSPLGLIAIAAASLVAIFATLSGEWESIASSGVKAFSDLNEIAGSAFQGIRDALAVGDFKNAAEILWQGLKVAWLRGTEVLISIWRDFKTQFNQIGNDMLFGFIDGMIRLFENIPQGLLLRAFGVTGKARRELSAFRDELASTINQESIAADNAAASEIESETKTLQVMVNQAANARALHDIAEELAGVISENTAEVLAQLDAERAIKQEKESSLAGAFEDQDFTGKLSAGLLDAVRENRDEMASDLADAIAQGFEDSVDSAPFKRFKTVFEIGDIFEAAGTFSGRAAAGLGIASSTAERTAKATEETARNTKNIDKAIVDAFKFS